MMFALLVLLVVATSAEVAPLMKARDKVNGEYIIKLKDSAKLSLLADDPVFTILGGRTRYRYKKVLHGFSATLSGAALKYVLNSKMVEYVEENAEVKCCHSWGIDRVNQHSLCLDGDTKYITGNRGYGANVFVIGTGVSPDHPEFEGRVLVAADFVNDGQNGVDCRGSGTHTSGVVGSKSYGIATNTLMHGIRVSDCFGYSTWSDYIAACDFVAASPLTNKVAMLTVEGGITISANDAIQRMIDADVAVAVSAGNNDGDACFISPASATNALTVGATDENDVRASFSNYGSCVDVFAPGVSITTTDLNDGVGTYYGTSMAVPHAAGVMALMRVAYPCLNGQEIIDLIKARADKGLVADPRDSTDNFLYCS